MRLEGLPGSCVELHSLTHGHEGGICNGPQFARRYVADPDHGVPFLTGSSMLHTDFTPADLLKKAVAASARLACLRPHATGRERAARALVEDWIEERAAA